MNLKILLIFTAIFILVLPASAVYSDTFKLNVSTIPEWYLIDYQAQNVSKIVTYSLSSPVTSNWTDPSNNNTWIMYASNDGAYFTAIDNETHVNFTQDQYNIYNISIPQFYRYHIIYLTQGFGNMNGKYLNLTMSASFITPFIPVTPPTVENYLGIWLVPLLGGLLIIGALHPRVPPMSAFFGSIVIIGYTALNAASYSTSEITFLVIAVLMGLMIGIVATRNNRYG